MNKRRIVLSVLLVVFLGLYVLSRFFYGPFFVTVIMIVLAVASVVDFFLLLKTATLPTAMPILLLCVFVGSLVIIRLAVPTKMSAVLVVKSENEMHTVYACKKYKHTASDGSVKKVVVEPNDFYIDNKTGRALLLYSVGHGWFPATRFDISDEGKLYTLLRPDTVCRGYMPDYFFSSSPSSIVRNNPYSNTRKYVLDYAPKELLEEVPEDAMCGTMKDIEGNEYKIVQLGKQVWMAENLRATKDRDGNKITLSGKTSEKTPCRYCPNNNSKNVEKYGYLYNWNAAKVVCPKGWHLPEYMDWKELINYLAKQSKYVCGGVGYKSIVKALASTDGWKSDEGPCTVGYDQSSNNATGFCALPAGSYDGRYDGLYDRFGEEAFFWTASEHGYTLPTDRAIVNGLNYISVLWEVSYDYKSSGLSVRCVKD